MFHFLLKDFELDDYGPLGENSDSNKIIKYKTDFITHDRSIAIKFLQIGKTLKCVLNGQEFQKDISTLSDFLVFERRLKV